MVTEVRQNMESHRYKIMKVIFHNLKWIDIDFEIGVVTIVPEKGDPRAFKISEKLIVMLNRLSRNGDKVLATMEVSTRLGVALKGIGGGLSISLENQGY